MYSLRWDIAGGLSAGLRGGYFLTRGTVAEGWRQGEKMLVPPLHPYEKSGYRKWRNWCLTILYDLCIILRNYLRGECS
jgi:hypothetical protein